MRFIVQRTHQASPFRCWKWMVAAALLGLFVACPMVAAETAGETIIEPIEMSSLVLSRRFEEEAGEESPDGPVVGVGTIVPGEPLTLSSYNALPSDAKSGELLPGHEESDILRRLEALEAKQQAAPHSNHNDLVNELEGYTQSGHDGATMRVSGRIHIDAWMFPDESPGVNGFETGNNDISPQDRLEMRRLRFGVGGDVWENMLYRIDMEFAGGHDPEFRDAFFGFTDLPFFQTVLIGNQKRPYGLDHWNSSNFNVFMERPFAIEAFNQDNRRLGIQSWSFSEDLAWNWQYGVFNQRIIQDEGEYVSDHWQMEVAGRLANTIWYDECSGGRGYAHWAIAGSVADVDGEADVENFAGSGINEARFRTRPEARTSSRWLDTGIIEDSLYFSLIGFESVINLGAVQLVGEYQNVWVEREADPQLNFHGGYAYASYFLTGEHQPWDRERGRLDRVEPFENFFLVDTCRDGVRGGWGAWQVALRLSYGNLSDDDIQGGIGESVTFGLNWYWNPWARMQLNYIYGNIFDNEINAVNGIDFGTYQIVGTRFMIDF